ncbi:MAG: NAD(P)-dependent oxidoreductase, partial [Verrucomicrobia bacterium]|nr:NAD(P)-dependent oxidoreductase [Verrucomicrobiota bacterium]
CRSLVRSGFDVTGTDIHEVEDCGFPFVKGDLRDGGFCRTLMQGKDALVHLANHPRAPGFPDPQYEQNMLMNKAVFDAVESSSVKMLLFTSTIQVYRGTGDGLAPGAWRGLPHLPLHVDSPTLSNNGYARSKLAAETRLRELADTKQMMCVCLRLPAILSAWDVWKSKAMGRVSDEKRNELFAYIVTKDTGEIITRLVLSPEKGYRVFFAAAEDNLLGLPAKEVAVRYYRDIPFSEKLKRERGLIDISPITRDLDWRPTKVPNPLPLFLMRVLRKLRS